MNFEERNLKAAMVTGSKVATQAELSLAADAVGAGSEFLPIIEDKEQATVMADELKDLRQWLGKAQNLLANGGTPSKMEMLAEMICGMSQSVARRLFSGPDDRLSVRFEF